MDTSGTAPEWAFFARIEKLEHLQVKAEDGFILAIHALVFAFAALIKDDPKAARKLKDLLVDHLETATLSPELLKELGRLLTSVCDQFET